MMHTFLLTLLSLMSCVAIANAAIGSCASDFVPTKGNFVITFEHDWNVFYNQILHQRAIACVKYHDSLFNTGLMCLKCV